MYCSRAPVPKFHEVPICNFSTELFPFFPLGTEIYVRPPIGREWFDFSKLDS